MSDLTVWLLAECPAVACLTFAVCRYMARERRRARARARFHARHRL